MGGEGALSRRPARLVCARGRDRDFELVADTLASPRSIGGWAVRRRGIDSGRLAPRAGGGEKAAAAAAREAAALGTG